MIGSNLDIMNTGWREIIFKDRNQAYGAYELRRENPGNTNRAMVIAISAFVFALALPTIINKINGFIPKAEEPVRIIEINNLPSPKVIDQTHTPPPPVREPARPRNNTLKFPPPIARADDPRQQEPPTDADLQKADPAQLTLKGDPNAPINIDEPKGTSTNYSATEGTAKEDLPFTAVEIAPVFPGGEAAFGKFLEHHIKYPNLAKENGITGRVFVQFIVERDGSLTDIKAVRDPGSGLGDEAIRVLKISPRWQPGIQNGRPVRVQYTIPVNFSLGEQ